MLQESLPAATLLLLVRHGENEWTESGKLAGRTPGVHLNDKGRAQAAQLAEFLARQPLSALYSSPLVRCIETAQPLAERLQLPVVEEPGLLEVDYGEWRGGELKELNKRPEWHAVQHFPSTFRFPQGETLRQVQQRAADAVERLAAQHPYQTFACFSHGDVIRTLLAHYAGVPLDLFQRIQISTASVSVLAFFGGRPAILAMNVMAELPVFEVKPPKDEGAETGGAETGGAETGAPESGGTPGGGAPSAEAHG
jgi:probable phosphoglycerate mutase